MEATVFTPLSAAIGGALIGLAASWLMLSTGRIAGISGIITSAFAPASDGRRWRMSFLAGMLLAAWLVFNFTEATFIPRAGYSRWLLVIGGLLVGYGTALGSGCTSGHGVCGLARLSGRSLAATLTFLAVGVLTAVVTAHFVGGEP